jgi:hypothetical protein
MFTFQAKIGKMSWALILVIISIWVKRVVHGYKLWPWCEIMEPLHGNRHNLTFDWFLFIYMCKIIILCLFFCFTWIVQFFISSLVFPYWLCLTIIDSMCKIFCNEEKWVDDVENCQKKKNVVIFKFNLLLYYGSN